MIVELLILDNVFCLDAGSLQVRDLDERELVSFQVHGHLVEFLVLLQIEPNCPEHSLSSYLQVFSINYI